MGWEGWPEDHNSAIQTLIYSHFICLDYEHNGKQKRTGSLRIPTNCHNRSRQLKNSPQGAEWGDVGVGTACLVLNSQERKAYNKEVTFQTRDPRLSPGIEDLTH